MYSPALSQSALETNFLNDNYCAAPLPVASLAVSAHDRKVSSGALGEHGGCVFKVGNDMYFVPTQNVAEDDMLYITCDAQKIEGPVEGWRSRLALGDIAESMVEDAIVDHLTSSASTKQGEAFVVTRDGKIFRL